MAYISTDEIKQFRTELKKVVPKDWKWSLRREHHSTAIFTLRECGLDLPVIINDYLIAQYNYRNPNYDTSNFKPSRYGDLYLNAFNGLPSVKQALENILKVLNKGNHNNSDIMTDYFDVGWYVYLKYEVKQQQLLQAA